MYITAEFLIAAVVVFLVITNRWLENAFTAIALTLLALAIIAAVGGRQKTRTFYRASLSATATIKKPIHDSGSAVVSLNCCDQNSASSSSTSPLVRR